MSLCLAGGGARWSPICGRRSIRLASTTAHDYRRSQLVCLPIDLRGGFPSAEAIYDRARPVIDVGGCHKVRIETPVDLFRPAILSRLSFLGRYHRDWQPSLL